MDSSSRARLGQLEAPCIVVAPSMSKTGAGDEARTRDINLGKVALYQLSYTRDGNSDMINL
jgi:hypothetical protein